MATKVYSQKPDGKKRRRLVKETTDDRIRKLRKALGLNFHWEELRFQTRLSQ